MIEWLGIAQAWFSLTMALLSAAWVLPVMTTHNCHWLRRYLRGEEGVGGTLRIGVILMSAGWWYQATGFPLLLGVHDIGRILLDAIVLTALFNAGRTSALSVGKELLLYGALSSGYMMWWGSIMNALGDSNALP